MKRDELFEMIANGESSKVEFKTDDVHPNALAEEIVAFANFEGGTILIGVDDSGKIKGYTRDDIEEFVINICRNNIKPSVIPVIEKVAVDNKYIWDSGEKLTYTPFISICTRPETEKQWWMALYIDSSWLNTMYHTETRGFIIEWDQ